MVKGRSGCGIPLAASLHMDGFWDAEGILRDCEQSEEVLREEWAAQVAAQTKPIYAAGTNE